MPPELLCLGEPMLEFSELPPQEDGRKLYLQGFGGDSSNAAIAAARQGASVGYLTALGEDAAGEAFLSLWRREGIETSAVKRDPHHPTAVYFITHGPAGHRFFYLRKDSAAAHFAPSDLPEAMLAAARIFFASGISLAISTDAADAVFAAIGVTRRAGALVAIDTNYRPVLWPPARAAAVIHAAIAKADIALPSFEDAVALTGLSDPDAILDFYLGLGPSIVLLKQGREGAILATGAERTRLPAPAMHAVDTTGAGDVFCGAFLARLLGGDAPAGAARYAVAAAALSTTGYGAVAPIPRPEAVRAALVAE
ncbi:MAG: sugar kinase [Rhodospirillales bacterium]|nr:sugar kinase [Rhodospirillales bacterium]